jgi:segregation and condensation protein A
MADERPEADVKPAWRASDPGVTEGPGIAATRAPGASRGEETVPPVSAERAASYEVKLPAFEGPLDLLLHLIQKHELDILDIPIAFVTEKYVEYITLMQEVDIDIASEYLVMAATLAHIKSKMLLPPSPEDEQETEEEPEDPRAELVRRLLEYQKYRLAAEQLGVRAVLGRDIFSRGAAEPLDEGPAPLAPVGLFKLLDAFEGVLKRVARVRDHEIDFERITVTQRINELSDVLRASPSVGFDDLFSGAKTRADVIITFLALLEMTRLRMTKISQEGPYSMIRIELAVRDENDAETPPGDGLPGEGAE